MDQDTVFYQALLARDHRFDGKFFTGVKTTGIYCRPICPARPKRENVEFFTDALAAERAGYRPCMRCRPEAAPSSSTWQGTSAVVQRALRLIAREGLETDEETFASRFGVTSRHLRRLFTEQIGQTPKQVSDSIRLNFARKLTVETDMPMTLVCGTAGFASLRRFNDAFKKRFHCSPSMVRKHRPSAETGGGVKLILPVRPPFDWKELLDFFSAHRVPGVDEVRGEKYLRTFKLDDTVGWLELECHEGAMEVQLTVHAQDPKVLFQVVQRTKRMFDLDADPMQVQAAFKKIPLLSRLIRKRPGLRLPQSWDPFETCICAILGQLVSVAQAQALAGQLLQHHGEVVLAPWSGEALRIFPTPAVLAGASLEGIRTTEARKDAIRGFSRLVAEGKLDLTGAQDPQAFRSALLTIRGIGPWTAEYVCLRAIGDTDAYPNTDLILKRVAHAHPKLDLELARPWRAYAAIHLWKEYAQSLSKSPRKKE